MVLIDDQILSEIVARDIQRLTGEKVTPCLSREKTYILPANLTDVQNLVTRDIEKVYGISK